MWLYDASRYVNDWNSDISEGTLVIWLWLRSKMLKVVSVLASTGKLVKELLSMLRHQQREEMFAYFNTPTSFVNCVAIVGNVVKACLSILRYVSWERASNSSGSSEILPPANLMFLINDKLEMAVGISLKSLPAKSLQ